MSRRAALWRRRFGIVLKRVGSGFARRCRRGNQFHIVAVVDVVSKPVVAVIAAARIAAARIAGATTALTATGVTAKQKV